MRLPATALLSVAILAAMVFRIPQGLYSDPAWQLAGVRQFLAGQSPTPNTGRTPVATDFSTDRLEWVTWWAPGTAFLAAGPMRLGLSSGTAVRVITLVFLTAGAIGWARWIAAFDLPSVVAFAMVALLPWMRRASAGVFEFSAETLVFGVAPWVLLAALAAARRAEHAACASISFAVGLIVGLVYWLKYSWLLAAAGILAWFVMSSAGGRRARLAAVAGAAVPVAALSVLNVTLGGHANVATTTASFHPSLITWIAAAGAPSVMWFDLEAALRYALMNPSSPWISDTSWPLLFGLPGALWFVSAVRRAQVGHAGALALAVWISSIGLAILAWTLTPASVEGRHLATAGLATLPLVVSLAIREWRGDVASRRVSAAVVLIVYIVAPAAYGVASVAGKIRRVPANYQTGPAGVYNPLLSADSIVSCRDALVRQLDAERDTWYLTDPITALDLPGRAIVVHADFESMDALSAISYRTSRAGRILALLPPAFETNGKGAVIRSSFPQAQEWTQIAVPCAPQLWVATIDGAR